MSIRVNYNIINLPVLRVKISSQPSNRFQPNKDREEDGSFDSLKTCTCNNLDRRNETKKRTVQTQHRSWRSASLTKSPGPSRCRSGARPVPSLKCLIRSVVNERTARMLEFRNIVEFYASARLSKIPSSNPCPQSTPHSFLVAET